MMNNASKALMVSVGLNVAIGGFYLYQKMETGVKQQGTIMNRLFNFRKKEKPSSEKRYKIAGILPSIALGVEDMERGFKETLEKMGITSYDYKSYNANGSRTLLRSHVEDILDRGDFDLVFSVGAQPSQTFHELSLKRKKPIPTVFTGVFDPVTLGIVKSEADPGGHLTGIRTSIIERDFKLCVDLLCTVKKNIKHVLIPYDPTQLGGTTKLCKDEFEKYLLQRGIKVKAIEIFNSNELSEKVAPYIDMADVIVTLRDHTVNSAIEHLIKLCNNNNVTLYTSDLGSVEKGAAIGLGCNDYDYGVAAAKRAKMILIDGKKPQEIPVIDAADCSRLCLNTKVMKQQNLHLDENLAFLVKNGEFV